MTEPIKGFDVSHHQDPDRVPWAELKRQGYQWCYIRAAYGLKPDRHFAAHVEQAERHGIEWGPYLYLRDNGVGPEAQAEILTRISVNRGQLLPCLDIEEQDPSREYLDGCREAAEYLSAGCTIYTGAVYRVVHELDDWADGYPLWIADYDGPIYGFGEGYARHHPPEAHQHTGKGAVAGYGPLDLNVAHDLDAFRIEPRAVEVVGDRVPELVVSIRRSLDDIETTAPKHRGIHLGAMQSATEQLADIIEQDAEAARGES